MLRHAKHKCPTKIYFFFFFNFSTLMSTHVINFCYQAGLGGESGSMANRSLMSWWLFNSTRVPRRPDGPLNYTRHMLVWNVERPPPASLAHLSVSVKSPLSRAHWCVLADSPRPTSVPPADLGIGARQLEQAPGSLLSPKDHRQHHVYLSPVASLLPVLSPTEKQSAAC